MAVVRVRGRVGRVRRFFSGHLAGAHVDLDHAQVAALLGQLLHVGQVLLAHPLESLAAGCGDQQLAVGFPGGQWPDPRVVLLNGQLLFQQGQAIGPEFGH